MTNKQKTWKGWAVLYEGKPLKCGWGTFQDWIFAKRWIAEYAIEDSCEENGWDKKDTKIIPVKISPLKVVTKKK